MQSELQIEGFLGPTEGSSVVKVKKDKSSKSNGQIKKVQIEKVYPQTGEIQNHYLIYSGVCLILIVFLLIQLYRRKTIDYRSKK